jgi:putative nucleotidyltransferase with HDIG domain
MLIGGGTYFLINATLFTIYVSISQRRAPWRIWIKNVRWTTIHYLALVPLAFLIAVSYRTLGILGLLTFFLPLLIARYSIQRYMDMREVFLDTITSLAKALEAKDPYTRGHADRVATLAVEIARAMGWSEEDVELIKYIGLLHDIGKIGIEDRILNKPGKYTEDEYAQMKRHSRIGAEIIEDIKLLGKGAKWVEHHHEWYNGRGYPDGLEGEEIPEGARILAVADAFDAMTSDRPYKRARTIEEARREVREFQETQFDPEIVEAFLQVTARPAVLAALGRGSAEAAAGKDE